MLARALQPMGRSRRREPALGQSAAAARPAEGEGEEEYLGGSGGAVRRGCSRCWAPEAGRRGGRCGTVSTSLRPDSHVSPCHVPPSCGAGACARRPGPVRPGPAPLRSDECLSVTDRKHFFFFLSRHLLRRREPFSFLTLCSATQRTTGPANTL